jgi:hypothetical protein
MGLEAPDPDTLLSAGGGTVLTPSGMSLNGRIDSIERPPVNLPTLDGDLDGKVNEIPTSIVDFMEFYLLNYFKAGTSIQPGLGGTETDVALGRTLFTASGCASCHIANLTISSDRRVADLETVFNDVDGNPINRLFATASLRINAFTDGTGLPSLKLPAGQSFVVRNFFADLKRHDLGPNMHEINYETCAMCENNFTQMFITEPLWGVGSTPPYAHDGRSQDLETVILRHGGEATASRNVFNSLSRASKNQVLSFLNSLILFAPDDTASNLQPKNLAAAHFPQRGHGAVALTVLFNDPTEIE